MKDLVTTLKAQHRAIAHLMTRIDNALDANDQNAIVGQLETLKGLLVSHLEMEDRELYPALMMGGRRNPEMAETAKSYAENMHRITEGVMAFFHRYSAPVIDVAVFGREWRTLSGVLAARTASEEASLFPLYDRMARVAPEPVARPLLQIA